MTHLRSFALAILVMFAFLGLGRNAIAADSSPFGGLLGPGFKVDGKMDILRERGIVVLRDYATISYQEYRIRARNIIYFIETKHIYAEGDVLLEDRSGVNIRADQIYLNTQENKETGESMWGRAYNVELHSTQTPLKEKAKSELHGVNVISKSAASYSNANEFMQNMGKAGMQPTRMNLFASDVRIISKGLMEATDTWASPSNFAEPHFRFQSKGVVVRPDEKVEAYSTIVKIGKVPVFYMPYMVYDLRYNWPWLLPRGGYNKNFGPYAYLRWGWDVDNDDSKWFEPEYFFWDTDYRWNRGFAGGMEMFYRTDKPGGPSGGRLRIYGSPTEFAMAQYEDEDRASEANMVEFPTSKWKNKPGYEEPLYRDKLRFLLQFDHYQKITNRLDARGFVNWFSDSDYFKEYFPDEWAQDNDNLTNGELRWLDDSFEIELVAQKRVNDFRSEAEYLPELRATLPGARILNSPFYLRSDVRVGVIHFEGDHRKGDLDLYTFEDRLKDNGKTPYMFRAHQETAVEAPIDLQVATLTPYVGGRSTFYSDTYDRNWGGDGADVNAAMIWGADLSTKLYGFFNNNTIRHYIEPTLSFTAQESPVMNRDDLFNVDEVDNYRESHLLTFRLHQSFEVKDKNGNARTFFSSNLKVGAILDNEEANTYNNNERFQDVTLDAALYPIRRLTLWGNMRYSPRYQSITQVSGGVDWAFKERFRAYARHTYNLGVNKRSDSNITTLAIRTQLWNKHSPYALELGSSYQWNGTGRSSLFDDGLYRGGVSHGIQEWHVGLIQDLDTFEIKYTVSQDFVSNTDGGSEYKFFVSLVPKGWVGVRKSGGAATPVFRNRGSRYNVIAGQPTAEIDSVPESYWTLNERLGR